MEPVMALSTLLRNPGKVKEAAKESIVRITEHGEGAYVFATEESFEAYVRQQRDDAIFEERLRGAIARGLEDVEAGRVFDDFDDMMAARFSELRKAR